MALDPKLRDLVANFEAEAEGLCQEMSQSMIALESGVPDIQNSEPLKTLRRALHTLKGTSATFGLDDMADFVHRLETLVDTAATKEKGFETLTGDVLLRGSDTVGDYLCALNNDQKLPSFASLDKFLKKAMDRLASLETLVASESSDAALTQESSAQVESPSEGNLDQWRISQRDISYLRRETEKLRELRLRLEDYGDALDNTMRAMGYDVAQSETGSSLIELRQALHRETEEASNILDGFEGGLRAICTVPASTMLEPLHRVVRDACKATGKRAKLSIVGGEVSADRKVLSALRGPLIHLLRNAVDHGIESPQVRDQEGKHAEGAMVIRVEQHGNMLSIEVSDDGKGLDVEAIANRALERGLTTRAELERLDRSHVFSFIFTPGFSTAQTVTELSGRGVGLDVVRAQLDELDGFVDVLSEKGQGTRFILSIPALLGSSPILLVSCAGATVGIPMIVVENVEPVSPVRLKMTQDKMYQEHRESLVPVKGLGALLGLRREVQPSDSYTMLIVRSQGEAAAIMVEEVIGDRDLVIHSVPPQLRHHRAYQGVATLARGEAVMILRPDWLVHSNRVEIDYQNKRALVVDDSVAVRAMHRTVLESGGFSVDVAANGAEALGRLQSQDYDVVVTDITMDTMDGFELVSLIRRSSQWQNLPVVMVSVEDSEDIKVKTKECGADSVLSKRQCESGRLLETVHSAVHSRSARA